MRDALGDDGIAFHLRPQLRMARQAQKALGCLKVALQAEGKHDGVVPSRFAFPCEDVVDHGRVEAGVADHVRADEPTILHELVEVFDERSVFGLAFVEIGFDAVRAEKAGKEIFGESFFFHLVLPFCAVSFPFVARIDAFAFLQLSW